MPPTIVVPTLSAALSAVGNAHVYIGDPFSTGGMAALGAKEGALNATVTDTINALTAPEQTGDLQHQALVMGTNLTATMPMLVDALGTIYAKISPLGTSGGGYSSPQPVVTTCVLIIPDSEVGTGLTYNGTTWAPAAPKHALWIWRAYLSRGQETWDVANGGKKIIPVTIQAMYATHAGIPEGLKAFCRGDPTTQGVTGLLL